MARRLGKQQLKMVRQFKKLNDDYSRSTGQHVPGARVKSSNRGSIQFKDKDGNNVF